MRDCSSDTVRTVWFSISFPGCRRQVAGFDPGRGWWKEWNRGGSKGGLYVLTSTHHASINHSVTLQLFSECRVVGSILTETGKTNKGQLRPASEVKG